MMMMLIIGWVSAFGHGRSFGRGRASFVMSAPTAAPAVVNPTNYNPNWRAKNKNKIIIQTDECKILRLNIKFEMCAKPHANQRPPSPTTGTA